MARCTECNSCVRYVWEGGNRYLFCDLCLKYYKAIDGKLVETPPDSKKVYKKINVVKPTVKYVAKVEEEVLPIDKEKFKW